MTQAHFCASCGAPLTPGTRFCTACGQPVTATTTPPIKRQGATIVPIFLLIVLGIVALGIYSYLKNTRILPPQLSGAAKATHQAPTSDITPSTSALTWSDAALYLPSPYRTYRYHEHYPDGDEGDWTMVTASLREPLPISTVETVIDPHAPPEPIAYHFLQKGAVLYRVPDAQPHQAELCLRGPLAVGAHFESTGVTGRVTAMRKTVHIGGATYTNCLVVARNYRAAQYQEVEYWAPGYGIVLVQSPDGATMRSLINVSDTKPQQAVDLVKKTAPNIDKVAEN